MDEALDRRLRLFVKLLPTDCGGSIWWGEALAITLNDACAAGGFGFQRLDGPEANHVVWIEVG